jgi:hypothetical protein
MSRDLPTGLGTALTQPTLHPVFLVELQWPTGTVNVWNGYRDLSWDSKTWVGTGHLGGISAVKESRDGAANGIALTLAGIPSSQIALALANNSQGKPAKLWFGEINSAGAFTVAPYLLFDGVIDVCPIEDSGDTATISVQLEKELIDTRARGRRYTHEDQIIDFPADLGFEFVAGLADKPLNWGGPSTSGAGVVEPEPGTGDYQ